MKTSFFLVASRGFMATAWLANALNKLPETLAIHGSSPERKLVKKSLPYDEQLKRAAKIKPVKRCGFIHTVNAEHILQGLRKGNFQDINLSTAQLFRNPIMLAESMAVIFEQKWLTREKYNIWARRLRDDVLSNRWNKTQMQWPASVVEAFSDFQNPQIPRLTGLWWRICLEAKEVLCFELTLLNLKKMGAGAPFHHQAFRYEDYTTDSDEFFRLSNHLLGGEVDLDEGRAAFSGPRINQHRLASTKDPQVVYLSFSPVEREMFRTSISATGLRSFFEERLHYQFPFIERIDTAPVHQSNYGGAAGTTINYHLFN